MEFEGLTRGDAQRLRKSGDRAREAYVRHFYGCDARNPALYHLVIDSTTFSTDTVVDVIAAAAAGR
jgi:cytidylate kinase